MDNSISVIIPTFNRCHLLNSCLQAFELQTYPHSRFEVIVVDDGSMDGTLTFLKQYERTARYKFRYLHQENRGPASARNLGVRNASGELVAFTDDDCDVEPEWLRNLVNSMEDENIAGVGGTVRPSTKGIVSDFIHYMRWFEPAVINGIVVYLITANACFRKKVLNEVNGFDERITKPGGEDPELCLKMLEKGYRLAYNPQCIVNHQHRDTLKEMIHAFYNYGRGKRFSDQRRDKPQCKSAEFDLLSKLISAYRIPVNFVSYLRKGVGFKRAISFAILWWVHEVTFLAGYRKGY